MADDLAGWRDRIRRRISQQVPLDFKGDADVERLLQSVLDFEVPTDAELVAMQKRGELPSDEELAREWR